MNLIWKFTLNPFEGGEVKMPLGAKVLHVHEQNGEIRLWAECDSAAEEVTRRFLVVPTGNSTPDYGDYVGSCHVEGGDDRMYVFHIYDAGEDRVLPPFRPEDLEEITDLLESTNVEEVMRHVEAGNKDGAIELLTRDYHLQLAAGNASRADSIDKVIDLIGSSA